MRRCRPAPLVPVLHGEATQGRDTKETIRSPGAGSTGPRVPSHRLRAEAVRLASTRCCAAQEHRRRVSAHRRFAAMPKLAVRRHACRSSSFSRARHRRQQERSIAVAKPDRRPDHAIVGATANVLPRSLPSRAPRRLFRDPSGPSCAPKFILRILPNPQRSLAAAGLPSWGASRRFDQSPDETASTPHAWAGPEQHGAHHRWVQRPRTDGRGSPPRRDAACQAT